MSWGWIIDGQTPKEEKCTEGEDCQVLHRVSQALSLAVGRMAVNEGQVMACGRSDGQDGAE